MPTLSAPISIAGPLIDCFIAVSQPRQNALARAGQPVPAPVAARALIDTGASCTCIDPRVVQPLGLTPIGVTQVHTPSTQGNVHGCSVYDASLVIRTPVGNLSIGTLPVIEATLSVQGFEVLIGRDVLTKCMLVYDGPMNRFTLAF